MQTSWRTSLGQRQTFSAKGKSRPCAGYVDPALVLDLGAARRNARNARIQSEADAKRAALLAEQQDQLTYATLVRAWLDAPKGEVKREALRAMRAYEDRTGRMPMGRDESEVFAKSIDVSTGAASWDEVK